MPPLLIDPGEFRTLLTLQAVSEIKDDQGGFREKWERVTSLYGRIEPLGGRLRYRASQEGQTVTHRITVRHYSQLRIGMRFVKGLRSYTIRAFWDADADHRYSICLTEGRVMNVTVSLTLEGLVRALQWKGHQLAEEIERRRGPDQEEAEQALPPPRHEQEARR